MRSILRMKDRWFALWHVFIFVLLIVSVEGCATDNKRLPDSTSEVIQDTSVPEDQTDPLDSDAEEVTDDFGFDPFEDAEAQTVDEYDPWEGFNILAFEFNLKLDKYLVKPVAKAYNFVVPNIVQQGMYNLAQNIRFVPRFLNNVFQAKFKGASIEMGRFLINSTVGIGGFFDPATRFLDLKTPPEDTGQTLGVYGVPPGPYLVVPFIGSFTLRDGIGYVGDIFLNPFNWFVFPITEIGQPVLVEDGLTIFLAQFGIRVADIVNTRSLNLEKFQGVEEGTLDLYGAVRNAYLQQRAKAITE